MRLVIVSNRLPVIFDRRAEGWHIRPGSGGLVTALSRILSDRGGVWIGWPGIIDRDAEGLQEAVAAFGRQAGYEVAPVLLTDEELHGFYHGFSNEIIWPLFHDLQSRCNFVPSYWTSYLTVTDKFVEVTRREIRPGDFLWVQDYHLMGLGRRVRERGLSNPMGFFLHIPFPPPDIFSKLPWRAHVLESLLWYDVLGFQTPRDLRNFLDCIREYLSRSHIRRCQGGYTVQYGHQTTAVGAFPIGVDYAEFAQGAAEPAVSERVQALRKELPDRQIVLGVDRLDYTKGIPERLNAFRLALQRYPELHRKVTLLQVVVPSRQGVPEYKDLKANIEQLVARINGEFTQPGWVPIHYVFREIERSELLAFYRVADIAFVTPLKDGMNLVSKEYCACQVECDGVLILSEFAGSAVQLGRDAVLVNPYDADRMAEALMQAASSTREDRRPAMRRLRSSIRRHDVHWWAERFLNACGISAEDTVNRRPDPEVVEMASGRIQDVADPEDLHPCPS